MRVLVAFDLALEGVNTVYEVTRLEGVIDEAKDAINIAASLAKSDDSVDIGIVPENRLPLGRACVILLLDVNEVLLLDAHGCVNVTISEAELVCHHFACEVQT